jgi:uncharacterized protein YycO
LIDPLGQPLSKRVSPITDVPRGGALSDRPTGRTYYLKCMTEDYAPGEEAADLRSGDFILTHRAGIVPNLISVAERRRYGAEGHWTHCALVVDEDGALVEAEAMGVVRSPLSKYRPRQYRVVRSSADMTESGRLRAVDYALAQVGKSFGFLVMLSLLAWLLTGARVRWVREDHQICSGLLAHALQLGGIELETDPTFTLPADLAQHFPG